MMIYVIRDNVSEQNSPLFLERNDLAAKRQFSAFLDGVPNAAADYDLYFIGIFEPQQMLINAEPAAKHIINGSAVPPPPERPSNVS